MKKSICRERGDTFKIVARIAFAVFFLLLVQAPMVHAQTHAGTNGAPGNMLVEPEVTKWEDVEARQALADEKVDRIPKPSRSKYISRMEYEDPEKIIAERKRIADFEQAYREAVARGEKPPQFWKPHDPARTHTDSSALDPDGDLLPQTKMLRDMTAAEEDPAFGF